MAPHSSTFAWRIPWMEEPDRLQSMGSIRVRHDGATSLYFSLSCTGKGNGNPLQCSCLENPRDGGAWWAAVYGVAQSQTRLKRLSSSSSRLSLLQGSFPTQGSNPGLPHDQWILYQLSHKGSPLPTALQSVCNLSSSARDGNHTTPCTGSKEPTTGLPGEVPKILSSKAKQRPLLHPPQGYPRASAYATSHRGFLILPSPQVVLLLPVH